MHDSIIDFFKDSIHQEIDKAKDRLASGICETYQDYQYEVVRIRTLEESYELFLNARKLTQRDVDA